MPPSQPDHTDQQKTPRPSRDFLTEEGRSYLYHVWIKQRFDKGAIVKDKVYTLQERTVFLADWCHWLLEHKHLNPRKRLPPYTSIGKLFTLRKKEVAQVIRQLRDEKLLPARKARKDAQTPQWTPRDRLLWDFIGHMRAMRFDQVRRLAARESEYEIEGELLSVSRTTEIVERWVEQKIAVYRRIYHAASGWIHLTRKGLREAGLAFRAEAPSARTLEHLYWINEVRLRLEDQYDETEMEWISERSIQAEQERRTSGQKLQHIQDGILVLLGPGGQKQDIDIEVQISKPSPVEVREVMSDQFWSRGANRPLRYYVNRYSRGVVRSEYKKMVRERRAMRPSIEVIDLESWQFLSLEDEEE